MAHAPPSEPIGTRDMDSTPPASTRSSQPEATFCAAMFTASRPEAQKRLSWTPATVSGRPALIAAVLAMSAPWSPIGVTQPSTTSSIRWGSSPLWRLRVSCINPTTRSTGLVACSDPLLLPLPRGVRTASNTSASVAAMVSSSGLTREHKSIRQTFVHERKYVATWSQMSSVRRSQAERSAATREALLDAAIECLIEEGYASTTTNAVAVRAGLSRGAHLHHFQTRTALVAAAVEQLAARWLGGLREARKGRPDGRGRTLAGLDLLWAHDASPLYQGAMDLWTDARSDDELREQLIA